MVKKYASVAAPLKKKISPHKLRSTFGTNLYRETGDPKYRPHPLMRKMVRAGWLGVKTGKGFFEYDGPFGKEIVK